MNKTYKKLSQTRRAFIQETTTMASLVAIPTLIPTTALGLDDGVSANEKIGVALIGCGGMGRANLGAAATSPLAKVTGLCDVWAARRASAKQAYPDAMVYTDYRDALDAKDIDAVIVATPPHWHTLISIDACRAGKDLYVQKPMSLHVGESLALRNAVRRHKRVCQVGTQIHAGENYRRCVEIVKSGMLGNISRVRTFNVMNEGSNGIGSDPNHTPPDGLDWDFWCGPYRKCEYDAKLAVSSFEHCWFMEFTGGWTSGMAPHLLDLPVWAMDLGLPTKVFSMGGRYASECAGDGPDTQDILIEYPNTTVSWSMSTVTSFAFDFGRGTPARRLGIYFHGVQGTMICDYGTHSIVAEGKLMPEGAKEPEPSIPPSPGHELEWLECIRTREKPSCNPDYHCRVDIPLILGNLSLKLGRAIAFDPNTESIVGDAEAAELSIPEYRAPWRFPKEYLSENG